MCRSEVCQGPRLISLNGEISKILTRITQTEGQSPCDNMLFIDLATIQHFHKSLLDLNKSCWRNYLWEVHIDKLYSQSLDSRCASLLFKSPSRRYNVKIASPKFSLWQILHSHSHSHSSRCTFEQNSFWLKRANAHSFAHSRIHYTKFECKKTSHCTSAHLRMRTPLHAQSMPKSALASQTGPKSLASSRGRDQSLEGCWMYWAW